MGKMDEQGSTLTLETSDREMGVKNVRGLFIKYSMASLIGLIFQMVAVIMDGYYVGNGFGEIGFATISVIVPLWGLALALVALIGVGASSQSANKLGEGKVEEARAIYAQGFLYSIIVSVTLSVVAFLFTDQIVQLFGASGDVIESAKTYTRAFMIGFPFYITGLYLYYYILVDEKPQLGAMVQIVPAIASIICEYIFIFKWKIGIAGSPLAAWGICVGGYFLLMLYFAFNKKTIFKVKFCDIKQLNFHGINRINKIGFAGFMTQISLSIASIIINNRIGVYGTDQDFAIYGVINAYIVFILINVTQAFIYGQLPIASYNYGAKLFSRVKELIKIAAIYSIIVQALVLMAIFYFADPILLFFCGDDPSLIGATKKVMITFLIIYPLGGYTFVASGYFQALNINGKALLNGSSRYIIFIIPIVYILPIFIGVDGIWLAQPLADLLSFLIAVIFMYYESRRIQQMTN